MSGESKAFLGTEAFLLDGDLTFIVCPSLFPWPKAGKIHFSMCVQEGTFTTNLMHLFYLLTIIFLILHFFQDLVLDHLTRKYHFVSNSSLKMQIEPE